MYTLAHGLHTVAWVVDYQHEVINLAVEYVRGTVHMNGIENFWSSLSSGRLKEPTSRSNPSISADISMSETFVSMNATTMMRGVSRVCYHQFSAGD